MNERIQELMRQSMVEHQFDLRFSPEKFAELIIRECIEMSTGQNQYKLGFQLAEEFREHFGVE